MQAAVNAAQTNKKGIDMSERLILDATGSEANGKRVPKIKSVQPYGRTLLVELLNPDEALGTNLHVGKGADAGAPQAYVLAIGVDLNPEEVHINVGDRVMLQGNGFVPVPNYDRNLRQRGIAEIHHIKAVMLEDKE